jgi:RNA polymerase sigma factor (sigma-70 family)
LLKKIASMKGIDGYKDIELIQKISDGEVELFEILIRRNNPYLYKTGRAYNFNREDTEDLMQDTFIDAFTNLHSFENRSSFKTWIIKIMLNNCFKKKQKWSSKNVIYAELNENSKPLFTDFQNTDTQKIVMNRELNYVIENALKHIPIDYRLVFALREINGLNIFETAEALEISEANVKVRLNRAKTMIRKEVEKSYSSEDIFEFNLIYCDRMVENVMKKIANLKI